MTSKKNEFLNKKKIISIWYHMLLKVKYFLLISRLFRYHWYAICLLINWYQVALKFKKKNDMYS